MISENDVRYVAGLARLRLDADEAQRMTEELAKILGSIAKINELDTTDVPPTTHVHSVTNVVRPDKPRPSLSRAEALHNAPAVAAECFRVPRMG